MKCLRCGAEVSDSKNKCPYCGSMFDIKKEMPTVAINPSYEEENYTADVYEKNINGCLFISTCSGLGSGLLVNLDGYGITNHHVVGNNKTVKVSIVDEIVDADVIAVADSANYGGLGEDLAIIKLRRVPFKAIALKLGDSDRLKIGESVCVIGNSEGKGLCITRGIVSDKRQDELGKERIMTDAATNPGNSGGPYFDKDGKVVAVHVSGDGEFINGINMKIKYQGMNFGIPVNHAKFFLRKKGIKV